MIRRNIRKIILGAACMNMILSTGAFADNNGLNINDGILIECDNISGELVIPSEVTKIGKKAFKNSNITKVKIPSTVKEIDYAAFENCANLKEVEIEDGLEIISWQAFKDCYNLTKINIPSTVKEIIGDAFEGCTSLSDVDYLTETDNVEYDSFKDTPWIKTKRDENGFVIINNTLLKCYQLKGTVNIPDGVKRITNCAFLDNDSKVTNIIIPDSVTTIGKGAFKYASELKSIEIPDSVKEIKNEAFANCRSLESVKLPKDLKYIAQEAFNFCESLKSIDIPDSVTEIKAYAFGFNKNLESVKLSKNLTTIEQSVFYDCSKLKKIDIPSSVTSIGMQAFPEGITVTGNIEVYNKSIKDYNDMLQDAFHVDIHRYSDGWHTTIDGYKFYKDGDDLKRATWFDENGKRYYFYNNGKMATGFIKLAEGVYYYLDPATGALKTGWQYIDNKWYYFNPNAEDNKEKGFMKTGWLYDNGRWYYFYSDGSMATGFINLGGDAYYYLDESNTSNIGIMKTGWQKINEYWYYFNKAGEGVEGMMRKGWQYIGGKWYYFYSDGRMATGFINLGGDAYYYLDESSTSNIGIMKTGWQKINGYWYYFNKAGEGVEGMMRKGWQYIGGKWYYFYYSDGKMAANTYIDGYYVNSSGAWVK